MQKCVTYKWNHLTAQANISRGVGSAPLGRKHFWSNGLWERLQEFDINNNISFSKQNYLSFEHWIICSILIKHFFLLKLVTPLNSTFKLVTTLHSTLDILDFLKELFVKFPLLNFQLLGLYLKTTFFVGFLYNRRVQCKNLPHSNRWTQTLGSCSMSSAPPLPATKKNNQNTSQSLR